MGIFQRATQRARILLTDNIQSGAPVVSTITQYKGRICRSLPVRIQHPTRTRDKAQQEIITFTDKTITKSTDDL